MLKESYETNRLILRPLQEKDIHGMYQLDSNEEVHTYLGKQPVKTAEESLQQIKFIQNRYQKNGIGRWAVIEKCTGAFIGWSGLKLITERTNNHINYYDLGYRFIKNYWGKGYATESAKAWLHIAFEKLDLETVYAIANIENAASIQVLQKIGLKNKNQFNYQGIPHYWFELEKYFYQSQIDLTSLT